MPAAKRRTQAGLPATVLVPLDGTVQATAALPVGRELARLGKATLRIVHVDAEGWSPREALAHLHLTADQFAGCVLEQLSGAPCGSVIVGHARALSEPAIVMCLHTGGHLPTGALGRTARDILTTAGCPVVLVQPERGTEPWRLRRVLVPHDGTPTCAAAIGHAAGLARRCKAELSVLHVPTACGAAETGTFAAPRYLDQPQHEWPAWAQEFLRRARILGEAPADVPMRVFLARGEAGQAIVDFASRGGHDLIALAWHGVLDADRAATLKRVIQRAPCPVMIYRAAPPAFTDSA